MALVVTFFSALSREKAPLALEARFQTLLTNQQQLETGWNWTLPRVTAPTNYIWEQKQPKRCFKPCLVDLSSLSKCPVVAIFRSVSFWRPFPRQQKVALGNFAPEEEGAVLQHAARLLDLNSSGWIEEVDFEQVENLGQRFDLRFSKAMPGFDSVLVHRIGLPPFLRQKLIRMFLQSKTKGWLQCETDWCHCPPVAALAHCIRPWSNSQAWGSSLGDFWMANSKRPQKSLKLCNWRIPPSRWPEMTRDDQ